MDESETVTPTPQEVAELEKFIKESSDAIAEKFRQMFKEKIIANGTYPETKSFQTTLFFTVLVHDEAKSIDKHFDLVKYFTEMVKETMNIPAEQMTPGLKAIEDLFEKYECMELASDIEKRLEVFKSEAMRNKLLN